MKPRATNRFALLLASGGLFAAPLVHAQTYEIDPGGAIPAAFSLAQAWEWDTPGDPESWTANTQVILETGTPTDDGGGNGSVKGTSDGNDPNLTSPVTTIATPYRTIIELRIRKESTD
ncbi:MAG: hypothetical protein KDN05_11185, partial [Verrucomicrobiae bacterium]|nr:hypothetical protein [Verrucomicrobiae bacterium]